MIRVATYKNLSGVLALVVVALAGALIWQVNKETNLASTPNQTQSNKELVGDYRAYANSYYNLPESEAIQKASRDGLTARVVERTSEDIVRTLDGTPNRLHLTIKDGRVTRAEFEFYPISD
jgi:hypothetical protein